MRRGLTRAWQLAILERAFVDRLLRRKALFRPYRAAIMQAAKQQLEVTDVRTPFAAAPFVAFVVELSQIFTASARNFGPKIVQGLGPIRDARATYLNRVISTFS